MPFVARHPVTALWAISHPVAVKGTPVDVELVFQRPLLCARPCRVYCFAGAVSHTVMVAVTEP